MNRSGLAAYSLALALLLTSTSLLSSQAFAASLPSGMTFLTTEKMYTAGQTVRVLGQIHAYTAGDPMLITVYSPDNKATLSNLISNAGPFVEFTFILDKNETRLGQWKIVAIYADQKSEVTFTLMDENSLHQAILNKPVLKDAMGGQLAPERQRAGQPMAISAEVENDEENTPQQFVFIAQVLDENKMPVQVSLVMGSMAGGQTASPSVNWTPKAGGTYTVEVFVWNSLGAPVPLVDKQASTFEILA